MSGAVAGEPRNGSIAGSSTRGSPPKVLSNPRQASQNQRLTHTEPFTRHGLGPLISPCRCTPIPCPWNRTLNPASNVAVNENGDSTNSPSHPMCPSSVIPAPLWIILFLTAAVIAAFMLLFADSGERAFVQASLIGTVVLVMSSTLLLIYVLDNPYGKGLGQLRPTAMTRTLRLLDQERRIAGDTTLPPCDARGIARAA